MLWVPLSGGVVYMGGTADYITPTCTHVVFYLPLYLVIMNLFMFYPFSCDPFACHRLNSNVISEIVGYGHCD